MRRLNPGEIFDERYLLVRLLGEGGMGAVWLAKQLDADRQLSLKVLQSDRRIFH